LEVATLVGKKIITTENAEITETFFSHREKNSPGTARQGRCVLFVRSVVRILWRVLACYFFREDDCDSIFFNTRNARKVTQGLGCFFSPKFTHVFPM